MTDAHKDGLCTRHSTVVDHPVPYDKGSSSLYSRDTTKILYPVSAWTPHSVRIWQRVYTPQVWYQSTLDDIILIITVHINDDYYWTKVRKYMYTSYLNWVYLRDMVGKLLQQLLLFLQHLLFECQVLKLPFSVSYLCLHSKVYYVWYNT